MHIDNTDGIECACNSDAEPDEEIELLEAELEIGDSVENPVSGEEFLTHYHLKDSSQGNFN